MSKKENTVCKDHSIGAIDVEGRRERKGEEKDIPASVTLSGVRVGAEDVECTGAGACAL